MGLWTVPFRPVCRTYQRQSKLKAECTRGVVPAFFFVFDFARSPADAKPPDARIGRCPRGVRLHALRCESTTAGHPRVSLACRPQDVIRLHGSARL